MDSAIKMFLFVLLPLTIVVVFLDFFIKGGLGKIKKLVYRPKEKPADEALWGHMAAYHDVMQYTRLGNIKLTKLLGIDKPYEPGGNLSDLSSILDTRSSCICFSVYFHMNHPSVANTGRSLDFILHQLFNKLGWPPVLSVKVEPARNHSDDCIRVDISLPPYDDKPVVIQLRVFKRNFYDYAKGLPEPEQEMGAQEYLEYVVSMYTGQPRIRTIEEIIKDARREVKQNGM